MPIDVAFLAEMARVAARGKRSSASVAAFLLDPFPQLEALARELNDRTYHPGSARAFVIQEPKRRLIAALPFRDRVVQHALIARSLPALERWFAPQSYACRTGKGTHRALRRATDLHRQFPWVLRLDLARFFPSIDHALLLQIILPRTPPDLRWLARRIVAAGGPCEPVVHYFPGDDLLTPHQRPHGLPIGNLTSQVWANAMLTPVDHLLASLLGLGTFVRYCDDLLVYAADRERLQDAWERVESRCSELRLRLHPRKCRLHRTTEPVAFLGFVLQRRETAVRVQLKTQNVRRFRSRMRLALREVAAGREETHRVVAAVRAWLAHARHGHTGRLCRAELERVTIVGGPVPVDAD